jgi:hypothetical protein
MKIFRKIRYSLLEDRSTMKYIKYSIGEILLVVIGILIALQINNWNETAKENRILNDYLVKIKSHTEEDLRQLDTMKTGRKKIADVCKKARVAILTDRIDENIYDVMYAGTSFAEFFFKPKTDGYESLKNSSSFVKINNTVLDSLLIQYHSMLDNIAENEKSYNDYILTQEAHISTTYDRSLVLASAFMSQDSLIALGLTHSQFLESFKEYSSSPSYRNVISLAAFQFDLMIDQYEKLENIGHEVIKEIDYITKD